MFRRETQEALSLSLLNILTLDSINDCNEKA
jgi:hypothetical protein